VPEELLQEASRKEKSCQVIFLDKEGIARWLRFLHQMFI
jgi:hypothetical protein